MIHYDSGKTPTTTQSSLTNKVLPIKDFVVFSLTMSWCFLPHPPDSVVADSAGIESLIAFTIGIKRPTIYVKIDCSFSITYTDRPQAAGRKGRCTADFCDKLASVIRVPAKPFSVNGFRGPGSCMGMGGVNNNIFTVNCPMLSSTP